MILKIFLLIAQIYFISIIIFFISAAAIIPLFEIKIIKNNYIMLNIKKINIKNKFFSVFVVLLLLFNSL